MKLIVGLGNPGRKYDQTRHNVGFAVLAEIEKRFSSTPSRQKFDGEQREVQVGTERCLLLRPLTFMNVSGACVQPTRDFYKLTNEQILVICDDLSLPVAKLRLRAKGSAGGQKGLEDVIRRVGSDQIARLRIGIGATPPGWETADYVLSRFREEERQAVDEVVRRAADAAIDWVAHGIEYSMNKYNAA